MIFAILGIIFGLMATVFIVTFVGCFVLDARSKRKAQ